MSESNKMELSTNQIQNTWNNHIQGAVSKFLKTAVIIDNQPWVRSDNYNNITSEKNNSGMDAELPLLDEPEIESTNGIHNLDLRAVSDVFSEKGVACAFVLPDDNNKDRQTKINRAIAAAKVSDLVVIDWYLEAKDSSLTLQILEDIAKSDSSENGRLRLICVYTGETLNDGIFKDVLEYLNKGGISFANVENEKFIAINPSTIIALKNKGETPAEKLPEELIKLFSNFANGLIPSFALAAVGAIRRNTHHMLTRFNSIIDPAYISNRLITNPSGDVSELMRELIVAECDNALGLERIADEYLENNTISMWLDISTSILKPTSYSINSGGTSKDISIDRIFINSLLSQGIEDNDFKNESGERIPFPEKKRDKISEALSGSIVNSKKSQNEFSRLVAFRRESYGSTTRLMNPDWLPSLTTGSILTYNDNGTQKYLMCFTPACDALRIEKERPFVFIEGQPSNKKYNLVITTSEGVNIGIYFDKKYPIVKTFNFSSDKLTQRVRGIRKENNKFHFQCSDIPATDFEWLGEIRYSRAASEMASLANTWMRIGIIDSEYLRLASKGHFRF